MHAQHSATHAIYWRTVDADADDGVDASCLQLLEALVVLLKMAALCGGIVREMRLAAVKDLAPRARARVFAMVRRPWRHPGGAHTPHLRHLWQSAQARREHTVGCKVLVCSSPACHSSPASNAGQWPNDVGRARRLVCPVLHMGRTTLHQDIPPPRPQRACAHARAHVHARVRMHMCACACT